MQISNKRSEKVKNVLVLNWLSFSPLPKTITQMLQPHPTISVFGVRAKDVLLSSFPSITRMTWCSKLDPLPTGFGVTQTTYPVRSCSRKHAAMALVRYQISKIYGEHQISKTWLSWGMNFVLIEHGKSFPLTHLLEFLAIPASGRLGNL